VFHAGSVKVGSAPTILRSGDSGGGIEGQRFKLKVAFVNTVISVEQRARYIERVKYSLNIEPLTFDFSLIIVNAWGARPRTESPLEVSEGSGVVI
jgi:hypothetical protein